MEYTSWGNRGKAGDTRIVHLFEKSDGDIATFPQVNTGEATVGEATWQLTSTPNTLTAVLPEGITYTATVPAKKFSRAKEITIDFGDKQVQAINEAGADWVYVDAADKKLGQFSGSNNGVRRSITEFEPDVALTHDEQVFLSWVTRTMLESRLAVTTMIATMSLLLMIPVALFALIT